jgi:carbon-monoxide dehydrogenase medium subunit
VYAGASLAGSLVRFVWCVVCFVCGEWCRVIPVKFDYARADSVDSAISLLTQGGEDAKIIAGGQSLVPLLRLRLAAPSVLVDVGRVDEMRGIRDAGDDIVIGAMTTHSDVIRDPLVLGNASLLVDATRTVADRQVRHRGTFGGSLAHADPAGDLPAVALALDAVFEVAGPGGRRSVAAADFFIDYLTTALSPDEVLVAVRLPKRPGWRTHYEKFNRTAQSWALVGVAVARKGAESRVALTNMASTPIRASRVEEALAAGADIADAAARAADGTSPTSDLNASAEYRRHLVTVLTRRALEATA